MNILLNLYVIFLGLSIIGVVYVLINLPQIIEKIKNYKEEKKENYKEEKKEKGQK